MKKVGSDFLSMCQSEMQYVSPVLGVAVLYAGKNIGYGLCTIADAIVHFTEAYRAKNGKEHDEVPTVCRKA